jgi:uncharacterized protein YjiS (DUF1127 family)
LSGAPGVEVGAPKGMSARAELQSVSRCRYRETVPELSQFSYHKLRDIGIRRCDIEDIVRRTGPRKPDV